MADYISDLQAIDRTDVASAGGKGAALGELGRIDGIRVPAGFCVTTDAFRRALAERPEIDERLAQLSRCRPDETTTIAALASEIRGAIERDPVPGDVESAIAGATARMGDDVACAVRSSATAEDTPSASFAGQHDTYLNVAGTVAIVEHVRRCWASLFTARAAGYRLRSGVDQRGVRMAVVVQEMVSPRAAGILFTADPITSDRTLARVEAGFGLAEALVSGTVDPDVHEVRHHAVVSRTVAGGHPALTDGEVVSLVVLGRRIEAHFGSPQDIEWCLDDDGFAIVQSRPITTLFPIPTAPGQGNHVYLSVGHQQMMTDAMKPLGLSVFQHNTARPMYPAGGRLFVDVAAQLASPAQSERLLNLIEPGDPLTGDALRTILERPDFISRVLDEVPDPTQPARPLVELDPEPDLDTDPAIVADLVRRSEASIATLRRDVAALAGPALIEFILADFDELKRVLFDRRSMQVIMAGMGAAAWLNEHLAQWLGERNVADTLTRSVTDNVTSEMGLALLDVADMIRRRPAVVAFLRSVGEEDDHFLDALSELEGGREAGDAIRAWLHRYGMRCVGEIDITRPRWGERPATLIPMILGNVDNFAAGERGRRVARGAREADDKEREVLQRLRAATDGEPRAEQTERMIDRVRTFTGYREYPKYGLVTRYSIYKQALRGEAHRLVAAGVLGDPDDIFYLTLEELHEAVCVRRMDGRLIARRKAQFRSDQTLTPPRVMTSDGEIVRGSYRREDLPAGALVGLPVSIGTVEGRARVVLDVADAELEPGDILVTRFTDPSWTPLFLAIGGLVTEVGGLMTHGAVIAREYGLPGVVGVEGATASIRDGQRIRVNGTDGYVERLT
jgi:pyruvate,water dikinase